MLFCLLLYVAEPMHAQHNFSFTQYTSDDGLSQNTITAMFKDSKGYLWLGTREGLNKFDGYSFTVFNSYTDHFSSLSNNRIRTIREDRWGYIWVKTYDDILYRLDVNTERLLRVPDETGKYIADKIDELYFLSSGDIWLSTFDQGCYLVKTETQSGNLTVAHYGGRSNNLSGNIVRNVMEDNNRNVWILTEAGITQITEAGEKKTFFPTQSFFSGEETERNLLFASEGNLVVYDKRLKEFNSVSFGDDNTAPVSAVRSLTPHLFLVSTDGDGFYELDILRNKWQHYSVKTNPEMPVNHIKDIYIDRAGEAWMQINDKGVIHFTPQTRKVEYLATPSNEGQITNPNYFILEDENDVLWIQPYYGSFSWYDRENGKLSLFRNSRNTDFNSLFDYGLNHLLADPAGLFWLSSNRGNGFFRCTFLPDYFEHYLFNEQSVYSISNETRSIFEDSEKRLWVGCKDGKLHVFDKEMNHLGLLDKSGAISSGTSLDILVYNIFQDSKGDIWLATKKNGIYRLKPSGNNRFRIENFQHKPTDPYSPGNNDFYSVTEDRKGRIWAGSYGAGLHLITEENGRVKFLHSKSGLDNYPMDHCNRIRQVYPDSKGNIWVATTEGLVVFSDDFSSPGSIPFNRAQKEENRRSLIETNDIHCIYEDKSGALWVGSFGGGLNRLKHTGTNAADVRFETFNHQNGMPNDIVYAILEDMNGNLWLTTENSIVKFNTKNYEIESFGKGNELENVEFSEASGTMLRSGNMCVGTKSGFYLFSPDRVEINPHYAPLVFTRLQLFNQDVRIGDKHSPLKRHIDHTDKLVLNHKQNVFTIEYATLDMRTPQNIQYAYRLKGFETDWNYVKNKRFATYTSLPPGDYTFQVYSTNSEGIWLQNERAIDLQILPSFWQSAWAKALYLLLILLLFSVTLYILLTIYKLKSNVQMEQQMANLKLRFFTDISHELRTPLTLVSLPVDNLLNEKDLSPEIKEQLSLARRNLDRVMKMINQILDFREVQDNKMRLKVEETDFGSFVVSCSESFRKMAAKKEIDYQIVNEATGVMVWIDRDRFDSILSNLLSNAFKFTPSGRKITVKAFVEGRTAVLQVVDEGIGIAKDKINFIFDRFFSSHSIRNISQKSTGIGLDLVKKLVELHYGFVNVDSELGKGSCFEVRIPLGIEHFGEDADIILSDSAIPDAEYEKTSESSEEEEDKKLPLILVVEDNEELRAFLSSTLKKKYRVEVAENGLVGWQKAQSIIPDFVVTDLLMPEMDGVELTEKIKGNENTSHIPVILLTAVTEMESKLSGMKAGVDDYITKPFSAAFLHARIENLIEQRNKLQRLYRSRLFPKSGQNNAFEKTEEQSANEAFLQKLTSLMIENMENSDLNIDFLASKLTMSRTVFFNKLKSLTGFSPVEFVREIRLQQAAEYVRDSKLNFSEIAYRVGFDDPRYFSRCFKQKFGKTPSEYRNE